MFACLFVPDFPVQAACRMEPKDTREIFKKSPIAILDGPTPPRVVAMNQAARSAGIQIGMTKLQVETCGGISLRKRSLANEESARAALLDCGRAFSPCVESTCPGTVILDLAGTEKLFGSHESTGHKIADHGAQVGLELNVGVAANPDSAMFAARGYSGITVIPEGREAKYLAPLEVSVLPAAPEVLDILDVWGIRTLQSLAGLPPIALTERLGQEGLQLQRLACGKTCRTLVPAESNEDLTEAYEFEDPVETLESLAFILDRLIQQLCVRLSSRSLATNQLEVMLELEAKQRQTGQDREQYERVWKLPLPVQDGRVLFRLAYLDLGKSSFSAPIHKITVRVVPVRPRSVQQSLFVPVSPETEQLEITLARIRGVVGISDQSGIACAGSPTILDSHKPDSFSVEPFSGGPASGAFPAGSESVLVLRIFRPALETSVDMAANKPHCLSIRKRQFRVLAASGPWCNSGFWWNNSAWSRDEWDIAVKTWEGIGYYRIYLDKIRKQWFVEGIFD
ncbi:MAG TPA: DNA polymerase Y family protein [Candidatus Aquilonibacter sp.]|nr:DNA polymerase Y family protein [Candidatus Aquilonibacter sp.]